MASAKPKADVTSYWEARRFLNGREERTIANNTTLRDVTDGDEGRHLGAVAVRLHHTNIVTYLYSGHIVLSSGGWKTKTTQGRINAFLPPGYRVHQKDFAWFVTIRHGGFSESVPFEDGMSLPADPANYPFA